MFKYGDSNVTEYYGFGSVITKYCYSGYDIQYVPYSGFTDVLYASDGENPKYASDPFELKVYYNNKDVTDKRSYNWMILGKNQNIKFITKYDNGSYVEDPEKQPGGTLNGPSHLFKVADKFNGLDTDDAILVSIPQVGWIRIPVHFSLDRFGNRGINGWDGNSITLDKDNGIILAPQVGAGYKDANNSFTGVLMGTVKEYNTTKQENGLFGFHEGARSFFISADNGKIILGKSNSGQIILDPASKNGAIIRSGNYDNTGHTSIECIRQTSTGENENYIFGSSDGMLTSSLNGGNAAGMIINFDIPYIHFGNGNFAVTPEGYLIAHGGGSIAGWNIGENQLYKDNVGMSSHWTDKVRKAFWAGLDNQYELDEETGEPTDIRKPYFCVDFDGKLTAYKAILKQAYIESVQIGDQYNYCYISKDGISQYIKGYSALFNPDVVSGGNWHLNESEVSGDQWHLSRYGFSCGSLMAYRDNDRGWVIGDGSDDGEFMTWRQIRSVTSPGDEHNVIYFIKDI